MRLLLHPGSGMTFGRLIYIDEERNSFKGEVQWTASTFTKAGMHANYFDIETKARNYCLEDPSGNAKVWVNKINQLLQITVKKGL